MTDELIVGCPISHDRAYILPIWKEYILAACELADIVPRFAFVLNSKSEAVLDILSGWNDLAGVTYVKEPQLKQTRPWNGIRYEHMVVLRNALLDIPKRLEPEYFLSIDSDILLNKYALTDMLDVMRTTQAIAVGSKVFMTHMPQANQKPDDASPSAGRWLLGGARYDRVITDGKVKVDIIMAIKLMNETAYNVDYVWHNEGEDLGWSKEAAKMGELWYTGVSASKHVMSPEELDMVDIRVGY